MIRYSKLLCIELTFNYSQPFHHNNNGTVTIYVGKDMHHNNNTDTQQMYITTLMYTNKPNHVHISHNHVHISVET